MILNDMLKSFFLMRKYRKYHPKFDMPFAPSSDEKVAKMLKLAEVKKGDRSMDLGAGDGKVIIAFARAGAMAYGIEADTTLTELANHNIQRNKLKDRAYVKVGNMWEEDLSLYDIITVYPLGSITGRLEEKIFSTAKKGCKVISNLFKFPGKIPYLSDGNLYLYIV